MEQYLQGPCASDVFNTSFGKKLSEIPDLPAWVVAKSKERGEQDKHFVETRSRPQLSTGYMPANRRPTHKYKWNGRARTPSPEHLLAIPPADMFEPINVDGQVEAMQPSDSPVTASMIYTQDTSAEQKSCSNTASRFDSNVVGTMHGNPNAMLPPTVIARFYPLPTNYGNSFTSRHENRDTSMQRALGLYSKSKMRFTVRNGMLFPNPQGLQRSSLDSRKRSASTRVPYNEPPLPKLRRLAPRINMTDTNVQYLQLQLQQVMPVRQSNEVMLRDEEFGNS